MRRHTAAGVFRDGGPAARRPAYNGPMPLLADLVSTSQRVAAASGRRLKVQELASFLKTLSSGEIETAVQYLS